MVPDRFLIGRSVHHVDEAREHAAAADYFVAGAVHPTPSKPSDTRWLGANGLAAIVGAVRVPVLAIGGLTVECEDRLVQVGAAVAEETPSDGRRNRVERTWRAGSLTPRGQISNMWSSR
jgi:thiamine monophosphate synthase